MARYVFPTFQTLNDIRDVSLNWAKDNRESFMGQAMMAVGARVAQHVEKKGTENIRPEILAAMGLDKKTDAAQ
jgi:limonene 1,2-monooxygenase